MPTLATLVGTVSVTGDLWPSFRGTVEVIDEDAFFIDVELDNRADVAVARRYQQLGVRVDLGGITLPDREVASECTIEESADRYGDTLTLRLAGPRFSPFARALLASKASITVYFTIGTPLNEYRGKVFTGYVVQAPHGVQPAATDVVAMDAAALFTQRRAKDYIVPPNSGKSRLRITNELLSIADIPVRRLDFPNGNGGIVTKAFAPGDRPILDALRDYLAVLGCEVGLIDGKFVAVRYDPNAPVVAELNPSNLLPAITFTSPDTLSANVIGVVSTKYERTEPNGERTVTNTITTVAPYAKKVYTVRQSVVGGVATLIPNGAGAPDDSPKVVAEVATRTTYFGSLEKRVEQTEKGWYAFRGAPNRIEAIENPPFYELTPLPAFFYEDGTTRVTSAERFQTIRRMIRNKELDADNNVVRVREERYFPRFHRLALWAVGFDPEDGLVETLIGDQAEINDDGDGVMDGREAIGRYGPDEVTETEFILAEDGTISEEITTELRHDIGAKRPRAANAFGYGIDPRTYTNRTAEAIAPLHAHAGIRVTTKRYRVIDEDRYEMIQTVRDGAESPTITTSKHNGSPPRPERAEAEQTAQEIRAEVVDERRILLAGEEIEDIEHNEFIETRAEAEEYARHRDRLASAIVLECVTPIETMIHKFKMVRVNLPGSHVNGLKFYVRSVRRDAATFREEIVAHHYAEEIG